MQLTHSNQLWGFFTHGFLGSHEQIAESFAQPRSSWVVLAAVRIADSRKSAKFLLLPLSYFSVLYELYTAFDIFCSLAVATHS